MKKTNNQQNEWRAFPGGQQRVLLHPFVDELLISGGRGSGKTDLLVVDFLTQIGMGYGPKYVGVIYRQQAKELEDIRRVCDRLIVNSNLYPGVRRVRKPYTTYTFPDGEELMLSSFETEDDYSKLHGWNIQYAATDELSMYKDLELYKLVQSTLRKSDERIFVKCRAATNPWGRCHHHIKEHFGIYSDSCMNEIVEEDLESIDVETGKKITGKYRMMVVNCPLEENLFLMKKDPFYISRIKKQCRGNEDKYKAWVYGSWEIVSADGFFGDVWNENKHVIEPFPIPSSWRLIRCFDYGFSAPYCVAYIAISNGENPVNPYTGATIMETIHGDMFVVGELYGWNGKPNEGIRQLPHEIAQTILLKEREFTLPVNAGPADTQIWNKDRGQSIADILATYGVTFTRADKRPGSRKSRAQKMLQMLANGNMAYREKPGLFFFDRSHCPQIIRTITGLGRDSKDPDDADRDGENHAYDAVSYGLNKPVISQPLILGF